jgi:hypothetical protein
MTYFLVEDKTNGGYILLRRKRKTNFLEIIAISESDSILKVGDKHTIPLDRLFDIYREGQVRTISKKEVRMYLI